MPSKRPPLANGEIYHVVIRAIENLKLFRDEKDYFRMIHDLFEFNDTRPSSSNFRMMHRFRLTGSDPVNLVNKKREKLVEVLAFCLMPNHVHLLIRQLRDGGISKFMKKIGCGYGAYYNQRYKRIGHVFQGRHKRVHMKDDRQLQTVFIYIHTNPVAIIFPKWKERGILDLKRAVRFLENYRWSSYLDYLGGTNFPSLTNREFLIEVMGGVDACKEFVNEWLQFKKELADLDKVAIE